MKRNKESSRAMRNKKTTKQQNTRSRYAMKRSAGKMMYGPGCGPGHAKPRYVDGF